jgi:diguanylate cyclase (GGDEF)-like protein/PAS domain S-box-containing protein
MDSERYPEESGIAADMPFPEKQDAIAGISDELGTSRRGVQRQWKQHDVSEQELHLKEFILDNAHEAIYLIGPDLRFVYVNDEACRSLGYSREELLGMTPSDIDPDVTHEHAQQIHAQLMAQGSVTIETRHRRRDGSVFSVEMQGALVEHQGRMMNVAFVRDISGRKQQQHKLELLEHAVNLSSDGVFLMDEDVRFIYVNEAACRSLGYSREELLGKTPPDIDPDITLELYLNMMHAGSAEPGSFESRHRAKDGRIFPVELTGVTFEQDRNRFSLTTVRDITERKHMEDKLAARELEFRSLAENSPDTIARYGRDCRRLYVNPAYAALAEGSADILLGKTPSECPVYANADTYDARLAEVFASGKESEFELKWADRDGLEVCSLIRLAPEFGKDGDVASVLAVGRDITELCASRLKIHQMAFYDTLTALPNRALFGDRLRQLITEASWHRESAGVMMLDLDRFKTVNDTMGHPAGDELLRETASRLSSCVRAYDTVARLGGDEFAILLPKIRSGDDLGRIATKMLETLNQPFLLDGKEVFVSCSIGIALYPSDSTESNDLLKFADSAMYLAKRSGRNQFRFYSRELTESASERMMLESELRHAIERKELELYYQPKVRLDDGALIGSEALLRWKHPQRGIVPPNKFIGIAEDSGLIVEIGEWVLREACQAAYAWNGADKPLHKVAINLSARQFQTGDLVKTVCMVLEATGCHPEWVELEITESLLLDGESEVLAILKAFRSLGISIAIDDFGTGYSALSYLARFPINTLKLDHSFIRGITTDSLSAELVKAVLIIAHSLGYQVVAEGVETESQAVFLHAHGCEIAQGYLYAKPLPKQEFERLPLAFS